MPQTEAFARTLIDAQLKDQDWKISDGISVRYEYTLPDGDRADYMLCGREGRGLAIIEAKRESIGVRPDGLNVAHEPKEWWMFSQERDGLLTVVFCDLGIGIPGTLPIKKPNLWKRIQAFGSHLDAHAIQEAIGESRTRTGLHHRGKGLKQLVDVIAKVNGGQVNIFSNRGRFTLKSGSESISQFKDDIYGTLITWQVPIGGLSDDSTRG